MEGKAQISSDCESYKSYKIKYIYTKKNMDLKQKKLTVYMV